MDSVGKTILEFLQWVRIGPYRLRHDGQTVCREDTRPRWRPSGSARALVVSSCSSVSGSIIKESGRQRIRQDFGDVCFGLVADYTQGSRRVAVAEHFSHNSVE